MNRLQTAFMIVVVLLFSAGQGRAQEKVWSFGGKPLRSAPLTAEYWNPILSYISLKSGVPLGA